MSSRPKYYASMINYLPQRSIICPFLSFLSFFFFFFFFLLLHFNLIYLYICYTYCDILKPTSLSFFRIFGFMQNLQHSNIFPLYKINNNCQTQGLVRWSRLCFQYVRPRELSNISLQLKKEYCRFKIFFFLNYA